MLALTLTRLVLGRYFEGGFTALHQPELAADATVLHMHWRQKGEAEWGGPAADDAGGM